LTPQEVSLIKAVAEVQPNTVVIINNGAPVVMNDWIAGPAAVLEAWMMGQAGGGAIADVLYGKVNPSGKLAETFPLKLVDTPAYINFPGGNGKVLYGEGIFIGYRYYDAKEIPVQFPFGFGMSYTTFSYKNPQVSAKTFRDTDGLTVSVDVTNTGKVVGKEVVQVYVRDHKSGLVRPPKELKGFMKIELQPGETRTVSVPLDFRAFAYYHPAFHQWITENGEFDILIGASSGDIRGIQTVTLESSLVLPSLLSYESTLRDWMEDSRGKGIIAPLLQQMATQMKSTDGGGEEAGIEAMGFLMEIPLLDALQFQEGTLPIPPVELVDGLLAQVKQIS
jgi:beta-glucosidase